jgi:hypothetical protein
MADQQHLLEELPQPFLGERPPLALDLGHGAEFMLRAVSLAHQWQQVQASLPADWGDVQLSLSLRDEGQLPQAAALLGPLQPTRAGRELRFYASRTGSGAVDRALARLTAEFIGGDLRLLSASEAPPVSAAPKEQSLVEQWDEAAAVLPADWSDVYAEIELTSSDHLDPAALALAPVNPSRFGDTPGFRFRCARRFGYGASAQMVRRCLTRLDERGIPGEVRILRALSDTRPVGTQGPVWYVGGKVV